MKKDNRNRKTAAVLAAVIMAVCVFGCGSQEPSGQNGGQGSTQESPGYTEESHAERYRYDLQVDVHAITPEEAEQEYLKLSLHEEATFFNPEDTEWDRICLRDYAQMHLEECRQMEPGISTDADTVYSNITDSRDGSSPALTRDEDSSVIWLNLETPLQPGEQMTLSLDYSFPVTDMSFGTRINYSFSDSFNKNPVYGLGNFYPILAGRIDGEWDTSPDIPSGECFYSPCSDYHAAVKVPHGWQVIGSGEEKQTGTEGDQDIWEVDAENVRDMALAAAAELQMSEKEAAGVTVRSWYYANHETEGQVMQEAAANAVEAYSAYYGDFPYASLDCVETGLFPGGMEYPQLVFIGEDLLQYYSMEEQLMEKEPTSLEVCTAHEVGHNWFYGVVGNDEYNDAWIDEGFASFSEQIYLKYICENGFVNYDFSWEEQKQRLKQSLDFMGWDGQIDLPAGEFQDYVSSVYTGANYYLISLQEAIGEEAFHEMVRKFYSEFRFREASTEDFIETARPYVEGNQQAVDLCAKYLSRWTE